MILLGYHAEFPITDEKSGKIFRRKNQKSEVFGQTLDTDDEVEEHCSWFIQNIDPRKTYTLLDIGCGTGRYTQSFANKGLLSIGIDKSPQQVGVAIKKIPAMTADAMRLPFPKNSFDVISAIMMLQQLNTSDQKLLFGKFTNILRKDGRVWIKTCSETDLKRRPFSVFFPSALDLNLSRYPKISELLAAAKHHGFSCLRKTGQCNQYSISGNDLLSRFREKHNTTLHMLPKKELEDGISMMEKQFNPNVNYSFQHYHTLIELELQ